MNKRIITVIIILFLLYLFLFTDTFKETKIIGGNSNIIKNTNTFDGIAEIYNLFENFKP